ncbi:hypothetical protein KY359_06440 [Candidatus Woesearchaeota archaeon]|nr:hypothetical protein [Candidatus Woesearchaeota archaeon]
MVKVFVSLNGMGDVANTGSALETALAAGADGVHIDIMDSSSGGGSNVYSFSPDYVEKVVRYAIYKRDSIDFPVEVGLFVADPFSVAADYAGAGVSRITIPYQAFRSDPERMLRDMAFVRKRKEFADNSRKIGLSFAASELKGNFTIEKYSTADYVTVVASGPGYDKVPAVVGIDSVVRQLRDDRARVKARYAWFDFGIAVQGGITHVNAAAIKRAGADVIVLGRDFFESKVHSAYLESVRGA